MIRICLKRIRGEWDSSFSFLSSLGLFLSMWPSHVVSLSADLAFFDE